MPNLVNFILSKWCVDWHDHGASPNGVHEDSRWLDYRLWYHRIYTCVLYLRASPMYSNHGSHREPTGYLISIIRTTPCSKGSKDLQKFRQRGMMEICQLVEDTQPFEPRYQTRLISISGISAKDIINCDRADEVGSTLQKEMIDKIFLLRFQLSFLTKHCRSLLWQHMLNWVLTVLQSNSEFENFIQYEFVNYAPTLFDNFSFRKTVKPALALNLDEHVIKDSEPPPAVVIDGGHLLHVVVWPTLLTYRQIIDLYLKYVNTHCNQGHITIVSMGMAMSRLLSHWTREARHQLNLQ